MIGNVEEADRLVDPPQFGRGPIERAGFASEKRAEVE